MVEASRERTLGSLLRLSVPLVIVNVGNQLMGLVDTALAGRLGALALGGVGLGHTVFMAGGLFGLGIVLGVDPLASQSLGAGEPRRARRAMWHGIYAALIITLPILLLVYAAGRLLEPIGIEAELTAMTEDYLVAVLPALLPFFVSVALRSYLQATRRTGMLIVCAIVANAFNFAADWVLIFGDEGLRSIGLPELGIPAFGVRGLAWATVAAQSMHVLLFALAVRGVEAGPGSEPLRRLERPFLRRVFGLGLPIGFQLLTEVGIFSIVGVLAATIGAVEVGSNEVALKLAALMFMVPLGISMATAVEVGRAIGRGDTAGTRRSGFLGISLGGTYMIFSAIVMETFPETLAGIMTTDPKVIPVATGLIRIAGVFQLFDGVQAVASGALRGAGFTRWAMAANLVAYWVVGFPTAWILAFPLKLEVRGLWWGLTAGLIVAAIVLTLKFAAVSRRPITPLEPSGS